MHEEDAIRYIVECAKKEKYQTSGYGNYGYDIYLPTLLREYIAIEEGLTHSPKNPGDIERRITVIAPVFLSALWELCRRGILRPGVNRIDAQSTTDGSAGCGYSITSFGRHWLQEAHSDIFVPTEPERFGQLLDPFKNRFGSGFHDRAQQAIRCYGAHAYIACCAMCGAAAESILLALAIAKSGDEPAVLQDYRSANGRTKVENRIIGKARAQLQNTFRGFADILKYWRDESAHGTASHISDVEAFTSLALLLRFSQFTNDNWQELTQ